jgi:phosphoglycerate dehydrogenase-like enzyme
LKNHTLKINVLFIWKPADRLKEYLRDGLKNLVEVNLIFPESLEQDKLNELAPKADIIIGWRPTPELLNVATRLKLFINPGAGIKHLIDMFTEVNKGRKVTLANGHGNSYFTAQHTVALLMALTNKVMAHHNWMVEGEWRKGDADGASVPLRDRKIGLLGYGHINRKVHRFLSGFDVDFAVCRNNWDDDNDGEGLLRCARNDMGRYTPESLDAFLTEIDTLIIAVPQTPETEALIGMKELKQLGESGLIVNVARGSVVDETSLYCALKDGVIAGAALDVWYDYSPDADEDGKKYPCTQPFHTLDNVVLSPHRAASPFSDLKRWDEVVENVSRFSQGRDDFLNVVKLDRQY